MHSSLLDRLFMAAIMLLVAAWAITKAVDMLIGVAPVLLGIGAALLVAFVGYRIYHSRTSGW